MTGAIIWSNELGSIKAGEAGLSALLHYQRFDDYLTVTLYLGTVSVAPAIDQNIVVTGRDGNVFAFDIDSGDEVSSILSILNDILNSPHQIWRDNLKGLGFHPLSLLYNEKLGSSGLALRSLILRLTMFDRCRLRRNEWNGALFESQDTRDRS